MDISFIPHVHLLHPKVIHFPIALFIGAMGMEVLSLILKKDNLHRSAFHMYILATVITPLVVLTGWQEAAHLHLSHPILTIHRTFALLTMGTSLVSLPILWPAKKQGERVSRIVFIVFLLMLAAFVSVTGHNGGRMVYEYGVGMEDK